MAQNNWEEVHAWRKARRAALIARRATLDVALREGATQSVTRSLTAAFTVEAGIIIGFCWPYKGELDPRFAVRVWRERGAIAALPEVVGRGLPLRFRKWWPGAPMKAGVMGIPAPDGTDEVVPDAVLVPMVAWDDCGYRLGYGGGYFDATLAALRPRPLAIGLVHEFARLATIYPQVHDIAMDFVVTESAVYERRVDRLQPVAAGAQRVLTKRCPAR